MKYQFEIMRVYSFILAFLVPCVFFSLSGAAQETHVADHETHIFTKGLLASSPLNYGREAFYSDPVAWQLYHHTLITPVEGASFGVDAKGQPSYWKAMQTDSSGAFRTRGFGGGGAYLYLTYTADRSETALLHVTGDGSLFFNGVPHAGDPYGMGWLYLPVVLKKGLNELYIRVSGPVHASLVLWPKEAQLNTEDPTIPVIVAGAAGNDSLQGAVVVINSSAKPLKGYRLVSAAGGQRVSTLLPEIPAMSSRKVSFVFNGSGATAKGHFDCQLSLMNKEKAVDEKKLPIEAVNPGEQYSVTFTSAIDGSLQYYAVTPQKPSAGEHAGAGSDNGGTETAPPGTVFAQGTVNHTLTSQRGLPVSGGSALFLSVHGAGVEAIGQARAYRSKDWGTLVAATNRRPRGFNWEDWGRLDALEVLAQAVRTFNPDPQLIYLTGHSMGGHGTWFLGATYPDKWAAIGACSGYPTLKDYGSHDGVIPDSARSPIEQLLLRASNQSDVPKLVTNYKPMGVYILHGDSDKVVPVRYARQMRGLLAAFHADMSYHEVPGAEHWYGNQSVDWPPMFDFFKWHSRKPDSLVNQIDFKTASPGISASYYWASIQQQEHPLAYSHLQLTRDLRSGLISGSTENIRLLRLALDDFKANVRVAVQLDNGSTVTYTTATDRDTIFLMRTGEGWKTTERPTAWQKGPQRYGTLKDAFRNHMVFVYSTAGNEDENQWSFEKARYDAETWYYRGNGSVDIIADKEYSPARYAGRSVILYGNASTNSAWKSLLIDCPIQVQRGRVVAGDKEWKSDSLGAYFVWPLKDAPEACVAVIGGSGLKGMEAADANQYFAGASGFPDFMIFDMSMLQSAGGGVRFAGFFDNDWKLSPKESEVAGKGNFD
jgi:pimeloyl-ACP methyl ester carboxylesterase